MTKYFFDVPVYRLSNDKYYETRDLGIQKSIDSAWLGLDPTTEQLKRTREQREDHFYQSYGPWDFNEIISYIRLYFLGTQIRGEYFSAEKARNSMGRTRVFTFRSLKLAAEINLWRPYDNEGIFARIEEYLDWCQQELKKGRYIDRSKLRIIGTHMNWVALLEQEQSGVELT